ncbi:uncharacterized protein LOC125487279 isoform X2 [Rhincodon typus]|uniref:uncharacterized protein LOC125487279 isoform X2 n=1 Tax=Rhincodon typus TaxID=259920 RepID=UPI00202FA6C4|nr:uncharacterized protein LOC125487279 isoform X2 [Rhincodon typus]
MAVVVACAFPKQRICKHMKTFQFLSIKGLSQSHCTRYQQLIWRAFCFWIYVMSRSTGRTSLPQLLPLYTHPRGLTGGSRQIQTIRSEEGVVSPLTLRGGNAQQDVGDDDAIIRQIGIQLRQMADQLHTYHMERVEEWDRRRWPVWYWTFLNFFMHTMAIFRMPRWR